MPDSRSVCAMRRLSQCVKKCAYMWVNWVTIREIHTEIRRPRTHR